MNKYCFFLLFTTAVCMMGGCIKNNQSLFYLDMQPYGQALSADKNLSTDKNLSEDKREPALQDNRIQEAKAAFKKLILDYQSLLERHPDFELDTEKIRLLAFKSLTYFGQLLQFERFKTEYQALESVLMQKVLKTDLERLLNTEVLKYKTFTPNGFKKLYDDLDFEHLDVITQLPSIMDDEVIDAHLRTLAEKRGYQVRKKTELEPLDTIDGIYLQPMAIKSFALLKSEALKNGIQLGILSGYRSIDAQKVFFNKVYKEWALRRIGRTYTRDELINGTADSFLNWILDTTSIPGYSKHHSGYAVDFVELGSKKQFVQFDETRAHRWLSANNFYNAKRFGFIPSYPEGAVAQGPVPEAWEYVWVGLDLLTR
jgi:hypothetical protein